VNVTPTGAPDKALVLVTPRSFSSGSLNLIAQLEEAGLEVFHGASNHDLAALTPHLRRAQAWIAGTAPVTAAHLDAAPHLKVVARYGVGVDAVDLAAAAARGIVITNTPGANSDAVAEHALALMLAALRHVVSGNIGVRSQNWAVQRTRELKSLTVGIAGYGRIGQVLAASLVALHTTVLAYDPFVSAAIVTDSGARCVELHDMPLRCDVVSLHAPGDVLLVDQQWLSGADGLILINTARSTLVDEAAVAAALRSGALAGYAADEIGFGQGEFESPLLAADLADKVILTPHSASQTIEAVDNMGGGAVEAVLAVLAGRTPNNIVVARL